MLIIFLTILMLIISCLILPGPDFFITLNNSIKYGFRQGAITALGIGFGIFLNTFITYWFGSFLQAKEPMFFKLIILIGTCYLYYLAFSLYRNVFYKTSQNCEGTTTHTQNLPSFGNISKQKLFLDGAFTNLANVKVIVFFSSMLSLVNELSNVAVFSLWLIITLLNILWFLIVAIFFGNNRFREVFFRQMKKIELVSGTFVFIFASIVLVELFIQ